MYFPFPTILTTIFVAIAVKADIKIITGKKDSCKNESNQNSTAIISSMSNIVRSLNDHEWSQTEENATSLLNLVNGYGVKQKVTQSGSTKTPVSDNFEDLKGRISMKTLDLIKQLHTQYLNAKNPTKQPESSSSGENKSKKPEIIHVSGRLEIL